MRIARMVLVGALLAGAFALIGCKAPAKTDSGSAPVAVPVGSGNTTQTPMSALVDGLAGRWTMKYTTLSASGPKASSAKSNTPKGWQCMVSNDDLSIITAPSVTYKGKVKQVGSSSSKKWHYKGVATYLGSNAEEITTEITVDAELRSAATVIEGVQKTTVTSNLRGHLLTAKYSIHGVRTAVAP